MINNDTNIQHNIVKLQVVYGINTCNRNESIRNDAEYTNVRTRIGSMDNVSTCDTSPNVIHNTENDVALSDTALKSFLRDLIHEYADKDLEDGYYLCSWRLYNHDRKILLSHVAEPEDYEYYCSSPERLVSGFKEHDRVIQKLLDETANEVYQDDMEYRNEAAYDRMIEDSEDYR